MVFKVDDNNIRMIRGDSGVFNISITDINGRNVELTDSDVLTFTLRRTARNSTIVLQPVTANDLKMIIAAVAVRSNKLHTAYRIAKENVEAATTATEVEAVAFEI